MSRALFLFLLLCAPAQAATYGPVSGKETLSSIAYQLRAERTRIGTFKAVLALYRANPQAFVEGNPNRIRPGSPLQVPEHAALLAVNADEAYQFYRDLPDWATRLASTASHRSDNLNENISNNKENITASNTAKAEAGGVKTAPKEDLRARPGLQRARPAEAVALDDPNRASALPSVPPPRAWMPGEGMAPVPDRWRLLDSLGVLRERWYDPYAQNTLKGDKPLWGGDKFFMLSVISDSIYEPRRLPTPVGPQASTQGGATGIFGGSTQSLFNQNLIVAVVLLRGDTTFRPPDWEYHFTPVFNFNSTHADETRLLKIDPRAGRRRNEGFVGIQELFADYHLRNVSDRYDFDSIRFGIQPFSADFRGFLFQDNQLMLRLFGTRDNNLHQYNLAWIRRLEKDTNSGLNDIGAGLRHDDVFLANWYRQDYPLPGYTNQLLLAHNQNREGSRRFYDNNGFLARPASFGQERPRNYYVNYLGYNGDGHFGRLNLTVSAYAARGSESRGLFTEGKRDIRAGFAAAELSMDQDWLRWRASALWAQGDDDPFDSEANGFDAIFENPIFAGADTSFWIRQAVPLIGGGGVALSARNGVLNSLRHSKEHGQSNFTNPGMRLVGLGADLDLLPQLRLSFNFNQLWFDDTAVLETARNQGNISQEIGLDASAALIWRPWMSQNIVWRLSAARLLPGDGFRDLFPGESPYSVLGNLTLAY